MNYEHLTKLPPVIFTALENWRMVKINKRTCARHITHFTLLDLATLEHVWYNHTTTYIRVFFECDFYQYILEF